MLSEESKQAIEAEIDALEQELEWAENARDAAASTIGALDEKVTRLLGSIAALKSDLEA